MSSSLRLAFPLTKPVSGPIQQNCKIPNSNWFSGFSDGESCFTINIVKNSLSKIGYIVNLRFQVSQHIRDENLLKSMVKFLGCGRYYSLEKVGINRGDFFVTKLSDILDKVIPFFEEYPLLGEKSKAFHLWKSVAESMLRGEHLTKEGLKKIIIIKGRCGTADASKLNKLRLLRKSGDSNLSNKSFK